MIKIGLCDDEPKILEVIKRQVESCLNKIQLQYRIYDFDNSKALWYEIEDGAFFDIILLDIEMPGLDGMKLAKRIHDYLPEALLIFVSAHRKYVFDSFKLDVFRFIPKDQIDNRLDEAVLDAVHKIQQNESSCYIVQNRTGIAKIPLSSIVKITRDGKNIVIVTEKGEEYYMRKSLAEALADLPSTDFDMVVRGTICNLAQIIRIDEDGILLKNGERLPLVRGKVLELKEKVKNYWIDRDGLK